MRTNLGWTSVVANALATTCIGVLTVRDQTAQGYAAPSAFIRYAVKRKKRWEDMSQKGRLYAKLVASDMLEKCWNKALCRGDNKNRIIPWYMYIILVCVVDFDF